MDQLIELLKQIQEIAGVGIDALKQASGGDGEDKGSDAGPPSGEGDQAPKPEAGAPPAY